MLLLLSLLLFWVIEFIEHYLLALSKNKAKLKWPKTTIMGLNITISETKLPVYLIFCKKTQKNLRF